MGSEPLGAGTGRPEESVYVQSLDAKKLGKLRRQSSVRWIRHTGGGEAVTNCCMELVAEDSSIWVFTHREGTGRTSTVTPPFALVTSIASLDRRLAEEENQLGESEERLTFANRFLLGFFMNETWNEPGWWLLPPPPPPGGWVDMEAEELRDVPGFMDGGREGEGVLVQVIAQGQRYSKHSRRLDKVARGQ